MPFTEASKNSMLAKQVGKATPAVEVSHLSLHTADPGATGANEVTGGGYARVAVTEADFDAPAGGEVELNNDKAFDGPASGDCPFFGHWDDATFLGGGAISGDTTFNSEGDFILKAGTKLSITD